MMLEACVAYHSGVLEATPSHESLPITGGLGL